MESARDSVFRANPAYELVLLDRLSEHERALIGDELEPTLYGALRPRSGTGLALRAASRELALLFLTLEEPGPLPAYVVAELGADVERTLAKLVLDGVLEIARDDRFVTGSAALELLRTSTANTLVKGRIGELSAAALQYGEALACSSVDALAARLYSYGYQPRSPALMSRFPDRHAVDEFVGFPHSPSLTPSGLVEPPARDSEAWRFWYPARGGALTAGESGEHKLYVSPRWDSLPEVLSITLEVLAHCRGVRAVKLARGLSGILRPDKLVAYFSGVDDLRAAAEQLAARTEGRNAHGVPFTASVTVDGLLSWGLDPPPDSSLPSWRQWLTRRLAGYLMAAQAKPTKNGVEPRQFALDRLGLDGVDTETWVPDTRLWERLLADA
jgi:hypothetical protein